LLACLSSFFYACESIYIGIAKLDDIGPIRLSCGMGFASAAFLFFPTFLTGALTETLSTSTELTMTIFGLSLIGATAYTAFVYTIRASGPIFASQVGYLVTVCGILWGIVIFGEAHSGWIWVSFVLMMLGLLCVSPRDTTIDKGSPNTAL
ncbi:MAG: EamA family transporter, partial [Paracoccaceae bacterium]